MPALDPTNIFSDMINTWYYLNIFRSGTTAATQIYPSTSGKFYTELVEV